jgi:hypothetical protein
MDSVPGLSVVADSLTLRVSAASGVERIESLPEPAAEVKPRGT